jgi:hypothetical protein
VRTRIAFISYLVLVAALGAFGVVNTLFPREDAPTATRVNSAALVEGLAEGRIDRVAYDPQAQSFRWMDGEQKLTYVLGTSALTVRRMARDAEAVLTVEYAERRVLEPFDALALALGLLVFAVVPVAVGLDLVHRTFTGSASGRPMLWAVFVLIVPVVGTATYLGSRRDMLGRAFGVVAIAGALIAVAFPSYLAVLPQQPAGESNTVIKPAAG